MYDTCICDVLWTFAGEWVCPKGVSNIQVRSGIHDCMYGRYNMHFGRLWLLAVGGWVGGETPIRRLLSVCILRTTPKAMLLASDSLETRQLFSS